MGWKSRTEKERIEDRRALSQSQGHFNAVSGWGPGAKIERDKRRETRHFSLAEIKKDPTSFYEFAAAVGNNQEANELFSSLTEDDKAKLLRRYGNSFLTRFLQPQQD